MKTFDLFDKEGRLHAFEVNNISLGRRRLVKVIQTIPGAKIVRQPLRFFSWFREEKFCEFSIGDRLFVAWEPYGDSSRYWVGADPPGWCAELVTVRDAFLAW